MIINRNLLEFPQGFIFHQLQTEIKNVLPLIDVKSTNNIFHFEFSEDIDEAVLDNIISSHIPDESIYYNNFSKLNISHIYNTDYTKKDVNSITFVNCFTYNYNSAIASLHKLQINYKYAYSHTIRNISIMILLNDTTIIDMLETPGLYNNLFIPNQVVKMINMNKGDNKIDIKISCSNLDDIASIRDIVLELYRI